MVLYIPTDIASRFVEEFITTHYMAFEVGVAFGKFFHQFMEGRALKTHFGLGVPLLDTTIVFFDHAFKFLIVTIVALFPTHENCSFLSILGTRQIFAVTLIEYQFLGYKRLSHKPPYH